MNLINGNKININLNFRFHLVFKCKTSIYFHLQLFKMSNQTITCFKHKTYKRGKYNFRLIQSVLFEKEKT